MADLRKHDRIGAMGEMVAPDDGQAWFWTEEWQSGEREVDEQIAAGLTTFCGSTEEFIAFLEEF